MNTSLYLGFRLHFNAEDVFFCFARHIGDAIEQLSLFVGDKFNTSCIREAYQSIPDKGWALIKFNDIEAIDK